MPRWPLPSAVPFGRGSQLFLSAGRFAPDRPANQKKRRVQKPVRARNLLRIVGKAQPRTTATTARLTYGRDAFRLEQRRHKGDRVFRARDGAEWLCAAPSDNRVRSHPACRVRGRFQERAQCVVGAQHETSFDLGGSIRGGRGSSAASQTQKHPPSRNVFPMVRPTAPTASRL